MCGNHINGARLLLAKSGSPPRVREPHHHAVSGPDCVGITPACAGTTHVIFPSFVQLQDHPRVCGNHYGLIFFER